MEVAQGEDRQDPGEQRQYLGDESAQEAEHQPRSDEQDDEDIESRQRHGGWVMQDGP